jgi:hypothetical protein
MAQTIENFAFDESNIHTYDKPTLGTDQWYRIATRDETQDELPSGKKWAVANLPFAQVVPLLMASQEPVIFQLHCHGQLLQLTAVAVRDTDDQGAFLLGWV